VVSWGDTLAKTQEGVKSFACHMANVRRQGYRNVKRGLSEGRKWMKLIENRPGSSFNLPVLLAVRFDPWSIMNEATTKIGRDEHVWSFDARREPVAIVDAGTVIEIETWDSFTRSAKRRGHLGEDRTEPREQRHHPLAFAARNRATRSR
jgi:hypothetical protein